MASGDVWKIDIVQSLQGIQGVNVFYWQQVGETNDPGGDKQSILTTFREEILPEWKVWASEELLFDGMRIQRWVPKELLPSVIPFSDDTGQVPQQPLQSTKAGLMAVSTLRVDQSGRGRSYFMGVPETSVVGSQWNLVQYGPFDAFVKKFNAPINFSGDTATYLHGIWSEKNNEFNPEFLTVARARIYQRRSRQAVGL